MLLKDRCGVYPDGSYLKIQPRKSTLSDILSRTVPGNIQWRQKCLCGEFRVLTAIGKYRICIRASYLFENVGKDKNSINICGGCWSSLRWAAICRLISTGYIIEIFFFLHFISISWRKCDPEAKTKMGLCIFINSISSMNFRRCYFAFVAWFELRE